MDFEIPPITQKGSINTLEGILSKAAEDLQIQQPVRRIVDPVVAAKIDQIIAELNKCSKVERLYTIIVDDPSGNSNIENLCVPKADPQIKISHYTRTRDQNVALGIGLTIDDVARENMTDEQLEQIKAQEAQQVKKIDPEEAKKQQEAHRKATGGIVSNEDAERFEQRLPTTNEKEIIIFTEQCWNCHKMGECRMVQTCTFLLLLFFCN